MYESKDNVEKEKLITTVSLLTQNHRFLLKQINIKKNGVKILKNTCVIQLPGFYHP